MDDPKNLLATQSIASLYYNMKDFPKARGMEQKGDRSSIPTNKEAYYTLGVIAWTQFVLRGPRSRPAQNMKPEDPGPLKDTEGKRASRDDLKADLKAKYWQSLTDGIEDEKKAFEIDPDYENAMAYMNLLIRYRADLDDTKEQYDTPTPKRRTTGSRRLSKPRRRRPRRKPPPPSRPNSARA